jgi:hypothetical protein
MIFEVASTLKLIYIITIIETEDIVFGKVDT